MKNRNLTTTLTLKFLFVLALFVSLLATVTPVTESAWGVGAPLASQKKETVIFVVNSREEEPGEARKFGMDALVVIRGGKFLSPMDEYNEKSTRLFTDKYYRKGQQYQVLYGGGRTGKAIVQSWAKGCNTIHALADVTLSPEIEGNFAALATNSATMGKTTRARRAVSEAERAAVMTLVKTIYRRNKTGPRLMQQLKTENLTAADLNGDGKFEIIGDFRIQTGESEGARRDLFLIATPQAKGYRAELTVFDAYRMDSGFGRGIGFLDQLDMDGDGISEVVTNDEGFDAYGYSIYKKQNGRWRRIYSGTGDAC